MAVKPYLKYIKRFKLNCILTAVSSVLAIISVVVLVFIPCFQNNGGGITVGFSLYNEAIRCFGEVFGGTSKRVWDVYQVVSIIYLAAGAVFAVVVLQKCARGLLNIEKYSAAQFEKVTSGKETKKGFLQKFNLPTLFVSGVVLEVLYMIMLSSYGANNESTASSLFATSNGVNWTIAFFILSFVAYAAVSVYNWITFGNLKAEIMREN